MAARKTAAKLLHATRIMSADEANPAIDDMRLPDGRSAVVTCWYDAASKTATFLAHVPSTNHAADQKWLVDKARELVPAGVDVRVKMLSFPV